MRWRSSAVVPLVLVYALSNAFWVVVHHTYPPAFDSATATGLLKVGLWVIPSIAVGLLISGRRGLAAAGGSLGLGRGFWAGLAFGLAATLPMAVVMVPPTIARLSTGFPVVQADAVVDTLLLGPFAEEVLFRGFLVTALIQGARWRPIPAIAVSALLFGMAHVAAVDGVLLDPVVRPFMTLRFAAGGLLFGWVFYRWGSLWPAVALHVGMNLWWDLSIGSVGRPLSTAQGIAVVLAVLLTLWFAPSARRTTGPATRRRPGPPLS